MDSQGRAMEPTRVLYVNKGYWPMVGGIERFTQILAENFSARGGYDVKVVVCRPDFGPTYSGVVNRIPVLYCGSWGTYLSMPVSFSFFWHLWRLSKWAQIVHWQEPFPLATIGSFLISAKKCILTFQSDILRQKLFVPLMHAIQYFAFGRVAAIAPTSPPLGENTGAITRLKRNVDPIPMAVEQSNRTPSPESRAQWEASFGDLRPFCLFVGRFIYYKGLDVLVEAAAKATWHAVLVGRGPLEAHLRAKIKALRIEDRVTIVTDAVSDDDLLCWYEQCRIFLFPSVEVTEAFGIVQLEAMTQGKPCVNTALKTGVPFVSLDGVSGLTVAPYDVDGFAQAVSRLWNDDALCAKLGEGAKQRATIEFGLGVMLERYETVYRRMLAS